MKPTRVIAGGTLTLALLVFVVPAALASDLEDHLANAADADYAGEQATWSSFEDATEFNVVSVEHAGSKVMVESGATLQVVGDGRVSTVDSGNGVALSHWSSVPLADRYAAASTTAEVRLGRDAVAFTIGQDGVVRARIWFDEATGAALGSEIYDGDGELFRMSWMLDFDPNPRRIYTVAEASSYDVVVTADADELAESIAGYSRVDTYQGPNDSIHSFYSDGLFSFSVFQISGEGSPGPFEDAETMELDSGAYRWILTPAELWVQWSGSDQTYVLVGDLPPDHLEEVLSELPSPSSGNLLSRIWKGIFG